MSPTDVFDDQALALAHPRPRPPMRDVFDEVTRVVTRDERHADPFDERR